MKLAIAHSIVLSLLPCLIPPYAFRLSRVFGTRRVGWLLFFAFSTLALLQVLRSWQPLSLGLDPALTLDLLNFLIPVMLLVSMVHIETLFRERLRLEQAEKKLRADLELEVKQRTAELNSANEDLQQEISLRKQGEQELRRSKDQYRFLFEENPQPMWIFDRETFHFLAFNTAALRHYGYTREEFSALTARDLCIAEEADTFITDTAKSSPDVQRRGLWRHCRKDGGVLEVEVTAQDFIYAGRPARLVLGNDVTAQRFLQKQSLQSQKAELTAQLAGGVADSFARLISGIEADAGALAQKCSDPVIAETLRRLAAKASAAEGLTRQMLALVRRHPLQLQKLDLNKLIEGQAPGVARLAGSRVKLERCCWLNLPPIMADPAVVEQVLRHLVLNACEAMPNGGLLKLSTAAVRVDAQHARQYDGARPGAYVCLTVSDSGCGMAPETRAHLFEPFFTTKPAAQAAGLGLATVQGLIKQHSGWVEVNTEQGTGSEFAVFFPCASADARS